MTKTFVFFFLACLPAIGSFAQKTSKDVYPPGTVSISLGPSIPIGEFASKNTDELQSGLAKLGEVASLSWWQPLPNTRLGFVATVRFAMNSVDSKATLQ